MKKAIIINSTINKKRIFIHRKIYKWLIVLCLVIIGIGLAVKPERYLPLCLDGLNLWAVKVLPTLLPFLFVTVLLTSFCDLTSVANRLTPFTSLLYRVSGVGELARVIGLVSGYPAGSKFVATLYENGCIDKEEGTKIALLSSTSGTAFVIGTVGAGLYGDKTIGIIIFIAHALSALFTAIIFRKYGDNRHIARLFPKSDKSVSLYTVALDCATSMLAVGTLIAVFYVISHLLEDCKITYPITLVLNFLLNDERKAQAVTAGLFECTQGCFLLSAYGKSTAPLCCLLISFGGLSVLAQSIAFLQKAQANIKIFIIGKAVQAIISYLLCYVLCIIFL